MKHLLQHLNGMSGGTSGPATKGARARIRFALSGAGAVAGPLRLAIAAKMARVGVVGLGYVGLPLAMRLARSGFKTFGFDTSTAKIEQLEAGHSYLRHVDDSQLAPLLQQGRLEPTADPRRLADVDVILICVPTPLSDSRDPDLSHVVAASEEVARHLRPGQLVVLESTTYPGTTRDVVLPILERSGLAAGLDYFLAYSPEREDPGNRTFQPHQVPKVVGGFDETSLELAATLYRHLTRRVVMVSSCEAAEATKILENVYRAVNIALVNELKMLLDRMGINVWEVIEAARTKPFGFEAFYPGPGLGGHCIPVNPFYLSWLARRYDTSTRFIELAGEINSRMPDYVYERLAEALNQHGKPLRGSCVCLLGVAYKPDIDDSRGSPAFPLLRRLQAAGATVSYHDPHISRLPLPWSQGLELASTELTESFLASQDAVVILTAHSVYDYDWVVQYAGLVIDTRNATHGIVRGHEKVRKA